MSHDDDATSEQSAFSTSGPAITQPGALQLVSAGEPCLTAFGIEGRPHVFGRDVRADVVLSDPAISRRQFELARDGAEWVLRDLGGANGTVVDGALVKDATVRGPLRVVRAGRSLFALVDNVAPYFHARVETDDGHVHGLAMRDALRLIDAAAKSGAPLLVQGESGTGKERASQRFHAMGKGSRGKLVAVNCAAIPEHLAEGLLFGARKGAHSGADRDQEGFFGEANGGTLFLDEIGELPLPLQAKLLRVLETGEYHPLGAAQARRANVAICSATHRELHVAADRGAFRRDLLMRVAQRKVRLPPLAERVEEIAYLAVATVAHAAAASGGAPLPINIRAFEACVLRDCTGENVRGVRNALGQAFERAVDAGAKEIGASHLPFAPAASIAPPSIAASIAPTAAPSVEEMEYAAIVVARDAHGGDVTAAAASLGISPATAYRRLKKGGGKLR